MNYWISDLPKEVSDVARGCGAPICILHYKHFSHNIKDGGMKSPIWYPDEDICSCYRKGAVKEYLRLGDGNAPKWIRRQHNIKHKSRKRDYFFTYEMLNANRNIQGNTQGINPDMDEAPQIQRFFRGEIHE